MLENKLTDEFPLVKIIYSVSAGQSISYRGNEGLNITHVQLLVMYRPARPRSIDFVIISKTHERASSQTGLISMSLFWIIMACSVVFYIMLPFAIKYTHAI